MVELSHVSKQYAGTTIVDDISLTVKRGAVFGFLGQNGAGKTTTIKMIVGLSLPNAGTITIDGVSSAEPAIRERIGFMPEAPYFYNRLSGLEFLAFCDNLFKERKKKNTTADYEHILTQVGIYNARHKAIETYSKGMKQRLGFAQAIVNDPEYIFLDEPLDGLDPLGRREIKQIIKDLKHRGKTIFFNSHILYDIEELCDEMGIIHKGKILYSGPVHAFKGAGSLEERFVHAITHAS